MSSFSEATSFDVSRYDDTGNIDAESFYDVCRCQVSAQGAGDAPPSSLIAIAWLSRSPRLYSLAIISAMDGGAWQSRPWMEEHSSLHTQRMRSERHRTQQHTVQSVDICALSQGRRVRVSSTRDVMSFRML